MSQGSNIDELRRLTEQEEPDELQWKAISGAVMEAMPDAVVVAKDDGFIVRVNLQAEFLFGYHRRELLGQPVEVLLPDEARDRHKGHRREYLKEPRPRVMGAGRQLKARKKNGEEFLADISLSPVMTPMGMYVVTIIRRTKEPASAQ